MSMKGNPHFYAEGPTADPGRDDALHALAYEQRTANLIAYQANVERSYFPTLTGSRSGQANELNRQILERLGLE